MTSKMDIEAQDAEGRLDKYLRQTSGCSCKTAAAHTSHLAEKIPTEADLAPLTDVLKAVSVSKRLQILFLIMDKPRCICEMESVLNVSQPTITHHIRIMQRAGIIETRRENKWLICSIKDEMILNTILKLHAYLGSEKMDI